jgi:hypothetical protein
MCIFTRCIYLRIYSPIIDAELRFWKCFNSLVFYMRFEAFTAVKTQIVAVWIMTQCSFMVASDVSDVQLNPSTW